MGSRPRSSPFLDDCESFLDRYLRRGAAHDGPGSGLASRLPLSATDVTEGRKGSGPDRK
jgi:hypothetical protein